MTERPTPSYWDELAGLGFPNGYPTEASQAGLLDELYFQRAVQVYLGALPAVNMLAIRDGSEAKWGAGYHILPTWKSRMDAKAVIPTPNADVIYAQSYLDLKKDGPLVVSVPPGRLIGMFTDFWQRSLTDVGIGGPDKGEGGLFLLLPPDHEGPIPEGYHTFQSPTYNVFLFWRGVMKPGADQPDPSEAVAMIERTLVYPLRAGIPSEWRKMEFPDASGVPVHMMYPRDASYFDTLAAFIDYEPVGSVEPYLRGMMASIGIVKGQPFTPDARHRQILDKAAQVAPKMAQALNVSPTALPERLYYNGDVKRYWINAYSGVDDKFWSNTFLNVDVRSTFFLMAYSSAPFMNANRPGLGARYPSTFYDAEGEYLVGDHTYRLHLPPDIPAALFWAVTLYSPVNGTMIDNGQPFSSINSLIGTVQQETDGSYDLYFAPDLPADVPEGNWIKTNPGEGFAIALRLYGATMPFYDQTWIPDDVVKV
jgi:hypothetical protein